DGACAVGRDRDGGIPPTGGWRALKVTPRVEDLLRELAPQVLGVLARRYGDFGAAEDAVQEALLAAATHWPEDGIPGNPRGWLIQAAARALTDQYRSDTARRRRELAGAAREPATAPVAGPGSPHAA